MHGTVSKLAESSPAITYSATSSAVLFWGLHVSDIAVILSAMAAVGGFFLQLYVTLHRIKRLERQAATEKKELDTSA